MKPARSQSGVSLVESLMVIVVIGLLVFLLANLPNSMGLISKSNHLGLAREIAAKQIEDKRAISYVNLALTNGPEIFSDSRLTLLPSGNGTVEIKDCDPLICTSSEAIKEIAVTVTWKENNKTQTISLKTFIGEGGLNQ